VKRSIGVFVNIGAVKDGYLRVPVRHRDAYGRGMEVKGMRVVECDPVGNKIVLEPDPGTLLEPRLSTRSPSSGRRRSRRPARDFDHPEGMPLEEVQEGALVEDGHVTMAGQYGIFVYFGAVKDGRLLLPRSYNNRFKVGDVIPYCQVASVDLAQMRVALQVDNPQDLVDKLDAERLAIEEFQVGHRVDGFVNAANGFGVFMNIKAVRDARLNVPRRKVPELQVGQLVEGMTVTAVDPERQFITLELPEYPLEEPEEVEQLPPPAMMRTVVKPRMKAELKAPAKKARSSSAPAPKRTKEASPTREPSPETKPKQKPKAAGGTVKAATSGRKAEQEENLEKASPLQVGCENVNGMVKGVCDQGLVVEVDGLPSFSCILRPTEQMLNEAREGDRVEGMFVTSVDVKKRQVFLSMESPELSVDSEVDDAFREKAQDIIRKTKPRAKADARVRSRVGHRTE